MQLRESGASGAAKGSPKQHGGKGKHKQKKLHDAIQSLQDALKAFEDQMNGLSQERQRQQQRRQQHKRAEHGKAKPAKAEADVPPEAAQAAKQDAADGPDRVNVDGKEYVRVRSEPAAPKQRESVNVNGKVIRLIPTCCMLHAGPRAHSSSLPSLLSRTSG